MRILSEAARAVAGVVSPRHRRWRQLLASLTLDPDLLPRPLTPPGGHDFIMCGSPRSGTTLLAAMLFQPPHVATVMEPWDGLRKPPAQLFADLRREIDATARLSSGRLDVDALRNEGAVRWVREQDTSYPVEVQPGWLLGVKWPAFWRYLELLPDTRFLVCVRHPYETIGSYRKQGGALAEGLDYDAAFNRRMHAQLLAATKDPLVRQVLLFDYVTTRILPHLARPNVYVVRYERWSQRPDTCSTRSPLSSTSNSAHPWRGSVRSRHPTGCVKRTAPESARTAGPPPPSATHSIPTRRWWMERANASMRPPKPRSAKGGDSSTPRCRSKTACDQLVATGSE